MSVETFDLTPLETFGGLVTLPDPADLVEGMSPVCLNVEFDTGGVGTRRGLAVPTPILAPAGARINGLSHHVDPSLVPSILIFTHTGRLYIENRGTGQWDEIRSLLVRDSYSAGITAFNRHYMAFWNGFVGGDVSAYWDNDNFLKLSPSGPGTGGSVADSANAGEVVAGTRKMICWWETTSGYWTKPSPPISWTAAGEFKAQLTNLPSGPDYVAKRRFAFTLADESAFYHLPAKMVLDNNEPTFASLEVDFTESELASGQNVDHLFRLVTPSYPLNVFKYGSRLVWISERNAVLRFNNLDFDGGFEQQGQPRGWQLGTNFAGGSRGSGAFPTNQYFGHSWRISGNGADAARGEILQNIAVDQWDGLPLIEAGTAYTVHAKIRSTAGMQVGRINIDLRSPSLGLDTGGISLLGSNVSGDFTEYSGPLVGAGDLSTIPDDLTLRVFADNTPENGAFFFVDEILIVPEKIKWRATQSRISLVGEPEAYDGLTGIQSVAPDDGDPIRCCFQIRENFYYVKENSTHITRDDGISEPAFWPIKEVSPTVGTRSPRGVGVGEDWVVILSQLGAYRFFGGQMDKISEEISPTWETINEAAVYKAWVTVDVKERKVFFGVPTGAATDPNQIFVLDYRDGWANPMSNGGQGRKWTVWDIPSASGMMLNRSSLHKLRLMIGNVAGNSKLYELDPSARDDDGAMIRSYYETYPVAPNGVSGRALFGYMTALIRGDGRLLMTLKSPAEAAVDANGNRTEVSGTVSTLRIHELVNSSPGSMERMLNYSGERLSIRFEVDILGNWFKLNKMGFWAKPHPTQFIRGNS